MIRIDRKRVLPPESLEVDGRKAVAKLRRFYKRGASYRRQRRYPFDESIWSSDEVRRRLDVLFFGKCAYCETPVDPGEIHHFRPYAGALRLDGRTLDPDHYWWLAYSWENLYLACPLCDRNKSSRFPVKGNIRGEYGRADVAEEHRLLLDPCHDQPEAELRFTADGEVQGITDRGRVTIEILGLNREDLVEARSAVGVATVRLLKQLGTREGDRRQEVVELLGELCARHRGHSATARALLRRVSNDADFLGLFDLEPVELKQKKRPSSRVRTYALRSAWIETISIHNFKGIHELHFEFHQPRQGREPWIMLIGPNAVGKSSVLKAIALALAPDELRRSMVPDARAFWNSGATRASARKGGLIRIGFNTGDALKLTFHKGEKEMEVKGTAPRLPLLAYGSTRLAPPAGDRETEPELIRIHNLFDPRVSLGNVEAWLADPEKVPARGFQLMVRTLRELLPVGERAEFSRRNKRLMIKLFGNHLNLRELSDGYQTAVALTMDIMLNLSRGSFSMEHVEGTVLIDEIGNHLHPSWKMNVVTSLRSMFPQIRFIVTTHDPLCLRGLEDDEIYRLNRRRTTRRIYVEKVNVPPGLTADELLTGPWFELDGTYDQNTSDLLESYQQLLRSSRDPHDPRLLLEERKLKARLGSFPESSLERLAMAAATELLAEENQRLREKRQVAPMDPETFREKLMDQLRAERGKA